MSANESRRARGISARDQPVMRHGIGQSTGSIQPGTVRIADRNFPCPRTIRVRVQSTPTIMSANNPCPRTGHGPQSSVNRQRSANETCPQSVRSREQSMSASGHVIAICPRPRESGKESSASGCIAVSITADDSFPIHVQLFRVCPHLIQPHVRQSGRGIYAAPADRSSRT